MSFGLPRHEWSKVIENFLDVAVGLDGPFYGHLKKHTLAQCIFYSTRTKHRRWVYTLKYLLLTTMLAGGKWGNHFLALFPPSEPPSPPPANVCWSIKAPAVCHRADNYIPHSHHAVCCWPLTPFSFNHSLASLTLTEQQHSPCDLSDWGHDL